MPARARARGQRAEHLGVAQRRTRLMKRTDEVLPLRAVNRRLAADGAVDHREERRRHLRDVNSAQQRRRGEPATSPTTPPPTADDESVAGRRPPRSPRPRCARRSRASFSASPGGKHDVHERTASHPKALDDVEPPGRTRRRRHRRRRRRRRPSGARARRTDRARPDRPPTGTSEPRAARQSARPRSTSSARSAAGVDRPARVHDAVTLRVRAARARGARRAPPPALRDPRADGRPFLGRRAGGEEVGWGR